MVSEFVAAITPKLENTKYSFRRISCKCNINPKVNVILAIQLLERTDQHSNLFGGHTKE